MLEESFSLKVNLLSAKLQKVENALRNEILLDLQEEICNQHAKVFLLWTLHEQILAKEITIEILEKDPNNLLALTNQALMFLHYENFPEVDRVLEKLNTLKNSTNFPSLEARGKAEIAFCISRISFPHYQRAIELFKEALQVCPNNYFWLFRLALLIYRGIRILHDKEKMEKFSKEATEILQRITSNYPHHVNDQLMAKTLVLLGSLQNIAFVHSRTRTTIKYFQRACSLFPQDRFVMEKSASFYLTIAKYEDAQKLLEEAIKRNETSLSHHHLGIIYRNQIPGYKDLCVKKLPFSNCKTQELKELKVEKRILKCPEIIPDIERNESVDKAEYHFKRAYGLDPSNLHVLYDLALLYRSVREYENAMKCFEDINFSVLDIWEKIKYFIQYGKFCFFLADKKESEEEKQDLIDAGTDMFVCAINHLSEILVLNKRQKQIWDIKKIMKGIYNFADTEYKSNLMKLIQSIKELPDEGGIFPKLLKECGGNELSQKLRLLCRQEKFQQAFFHLEFSGCQQSEIDVDLRKTIYLQYAKEFYGKRQKVATIIFKKYYELCFGYSQESGHKVCTLSSSKIPFFQYDVYILTSKSDNGDAKHLAESLVTYFGLQTSYGDSDFTLGIGKMVNVHKVMEDSCHIGIFYSPDILSETEYAMEIMKNRKLKTGKIFLINSSEIPKHLQSFPNVDYKNKNHTELLRLFELLCSSEIDREMDG
ncbi:uncharacterized protein LOC106879869 [Octopus bimaculoides]|uniref:TIR domain-containing protein n=1 Tax=Octopus bimaculoides TaxID=37653 RepID=A0A0L8G1G1_OCTBM|nr:uncharacterized protein LOC106879869 [Octopus bimaculoides]|eukprot:XP_014785074.1 PREDICTED: uncharacterized protein LOC106879869 [Octopus bimaculoides]